MAHKGSLARLTPPHLFTFMFFVAVFIALHPQQQHLQGSPFALACASRSIPKPRPTTSSRSSATTSPASFGSSMHQHTLATPTTISKASSSLASMGNSFMAATVTLATTTMASIASTAATTTTTTTTVRPNITFTTDKCPATYDAWYCLNDATCFSVKIGETIMYSCECAIGFMGQRCEYKELDGSYLPKRPRPLLEKAGMFRGASFAVLFIFMGLTLYMRCDQARNGTAIGTKTSARINGANSCHNRPSELERQSGRGDVADNVMEGEEIEFEMRDSSAMQCRYCHGTIKHCCTPTDDEGKMSGASGGGPSNNGVAPALWQQIETMPISFAIKRTTKL